MVCSLWVNVLTCIQGPKNQQPVVVEDVKDAFGSPIGKHLNAGKNWAKLKMYEYRMVSHIVMSSSSDKLFLLDSDT